MNEYINHHGRERKEQGFVNVATLFDLLGKPLAELDFLNGSNRSNQELRVDVLDEGDRYEIVADLPGVNKSEIKLSFDDGNLTLSARHHVAEENASERRYVIRERVEGSFTRTLRFEDADAQGISAAFNDGVLRVTVKKSVRPSATEIHIN